MQWLSMIESVEYMYSPKHSVAVSYCSSIEQSSSIVSIWHGVLQSKERYEMNTKLELHRVMLMGRRVWGPGKVFIKRHR